MLYTLISLPKQEGAGRMSPSVFSPRKGDFIPALALFRLHGRDHGGEMRTDIRGLLAGEPQLPAADLLPRKASAILLLSLL